MKGKNILLIGLGGILAFSLLGGTGLLVRNIVRNLSYNFIRATRPNVSVNLSGINLSFSIFYEIINRNEISGTISGFSGQVFYKGQPISNIQLAEAVDIQANSSTDIELFLSTDVLNSASEIITIFTTSGVEFFVEIKGRILTSFGDLPINASIPLVPSRVGG
ncbi:MAG: LEA type 2 family protein [Bacteroidota bacterium]